MLSCLSGLPDVFCELLKTINVWLGGSNYLSSLIQTVGLALLTILIPLAISVLIDVLQKTKDKSIEFAKLDLHVILDNVFRIKHLLIYVVLIYVPLFFWETSSGRFRFIELVVSIVGIILLGNVIIDVYHWVKGDTYKYRFSYLKELKNQDAMLVVWRSVWQTKDTNLQIKEDFFKIFASKIDNLLEQ